MLSPNIELIPMRAIEAKRAYPNQTAKQNVGQSLRHVAHRADHQDTHAEPRDPSPVTQSDPQADKTPPENVGADDPQDGAARVPHAMLI